MTGIVPVVADLAHFNPINFTQLKTSSKAYAANSGRINIS